MPTNPGPTVIEVAASNGVQAVAEKSLPDLRPVVILLGEYDSALGPNIRALFSRGLLGMASEADAIILDDGASSGCSADLGASLPEIEKPPLLVGVTSSGPPYDANHALVFHVAPAGSDSLPWSLQLASVLAKCDRPSSKPVVLMVVGGGEREKTAIVRAARKGWPMVLVTGTGQEKISDTIARARQPQADGTPAPTTSDPVLREIVETGSIYSFELNQSIDQLKLILSAQLHKSLDGLETAASWYWDLDQAAVNRQNVFRQMQNMLLGLGVVSTFLAILYKASLPEWMIHDPSYGRIVALAAVYKELWHKSLNVLLIVLPIVVSILTAANSRFRAGNKWILLRAAAEAIKREIFKFRARAGAYSDSQCAQVSCSSKLAAKLREITQALIQTEVNKGSIARFTGNHQQDIQEFQKKKAQDLQKWQKLLTAEEYVKERLHDQVTYYHTTSAKLNRRMRNLYVAIFVAGGLGTLVAALGVPAWVALTTALATAFTTKLEIDDTEESLVQYNIALTGLRNVDAWWTSLSQWEKGRRQNIDLLVEQTEDVLAGELTGWVQQMQSALDKLMERQEKERPQQQARGAQA
jgi:hypothetical protein